MGGFLIGTGMAAVLAVVAYVGYVSFDVPTGNVSDISTKLGSDVVEDGFTGE
jgi:hypothetical protein